ncbi:MAG: hypothetical protein ACKOIB_02870, partial [Verrucomicrobiota bacterium]
MKPRASMLKTLALSALVLTGSAAFAADAKPASNPKQDMSDISKCPVMGNPAPANRHTAAGAMTNRDWWPNQLNLSILHQNNVRG